MLILFKKKNPSGLFMLKFMACLLLGNDIHNVSYNTCLFVHWVTFIEKSEALEITD